VAHYGCVSRRIRFLGQSARAVQICDVMVDPAERAVMTKTGAFFQAASASQESIIGFEGRHVCGYGFPNHRAMVLGRRAGLYAEVEQLVEVRWPPRAGGRPSLLTTARPVARVRDHAQSLDKLWDSMANDLARLIVGIRDVDYLHYRYEQNPQFAYRLFLVRNRVSGRARGLIVLRPDGEICRLIDVVGPLRDLPLLVEYARRIADRWGLPLVTWITSQQAHWFNTPDAEKKPTGIHIPGNCYLERVPVSELRDRWWLMMGDTDFM
jgi:hypothetical protein